MKSELRKTHCALCHQQRPLCRSHIIPEFLYTTLYDTDHRFIEMIDVDKGKIRKGQKGYWEHMLCTDCEAKLNCYERHSRRLFVDPLPAHIPRSKKIREHPRLDYTNFKLFCLSILWRASVSSNQRFKHVTLGPHEEKIREMLLQDSAGDSHAYAVQIFALYFEGSHFRDFFVEPTYMRVDGRRCYRFVFMGFVIFVYVSTHPISIGQHRLAISPTKTLQTFDVELGDFKFLRELWDRVCKSANDHP